MVDPITLIPSALNADAAGAASAKVAATIVEDLVRPSAQVVGRHWANRVEDWVESSNARRVLKLAARRVNSTQPSNRAAEGAVAARVAAAILDGAVFAENEIAAEYLSGVLASSRSEDRNDRGQPWAALVSRLSSDQIRLHFIIYRLLRKLLLGKDMNIMVLSYSWIYIPFRELNEAMCWPEGDDTGFTQAFYGLHREGLVAPADFWFGPPEMIYEVTGTSVPEPGLVVTPSRAGLGLFLWGLGHGDLKLEAVIDRKVALDLVAAEDPSTRISGAMSLPLPATPELVPDPSPNRAARRARKPNR
ncbi:hypothetical protein AB4Y63_09880 [Leifsonia sp. YAF41]|uniref:hypothetical protein n=1 Tax=Leifsonia sp. YAF41 TaxID=3233086 RepID=UPI003F97B262